MARTPLWRQLRVGDRVRLVSMPLEFAVVPRDTIRVYSKLLARGRSLRVWMIDEYGHPWVQCRFRMRSGGWERHTIAINHGGIVLAGVRARPRTATSRRCR